MRVQQWVLTAALVAVPALAAAQATTTTTTPDSTSTSDRRRRTTAPQGTSTTQTTTTRTTTNDADLDDIDSTPGGWFASAFVGSDFGQSADESSVDFGGALGYTSGWFGAEFLAGFTPNFQIATSCSSTSRRSTATCST